MDPINKKPLYVSINIPAPWISMDPMTIFYYNMIAEPFWMHDPSLFLMAGEL